ncbi:MAG: hypothetical protein HY549_04645 [Elusimicrobia bacterium]|nr:hypothetical protein [Elusimicrobiota bacterium]
MKIKHVKDKAEQYWSLTKKLVAFSCVWALIFSLVTITRLGVAFDYDETLVFSTPAFQKAFTNGSQPFSTGFWSIVNQSYELERPKVVPYTLAWAFRLFGFRVTVFSARPPVDAEPLRKEWRRLVPRDQFVFVPDERAKQQHLQNGNYILYFGDSDADIEQARKARVYPVRILRSRRALHKDDYRPGYFKELVIPWSEYALSV